MTPLEQEAVTIAESVAQRFVKGGLAGAGAALAVLTIHQPTTWLDLKTALITLIYAGVVGFMTGGFLAIEKYLNWTDAPTA